jgi:hypothetical protein
MYQNSQPKKDLFARRNIPSTFAADIHYRKAMLEGICPTT